MTRVLAVDFGDRRTGLAGTDYTGTIVTPLPALQGLNDETCAGAIAALADERDAELILLGLPLDSRGQEGPRAARTRQFEKILLKQTDCPVQTFDERHTTDEAHALLKQGGIKAARRKKLADSVAALVILKRFLQM